MINKHINAEIEKKFSFIELGRDLEALENSQKEHIAEITEYYTEQIKIQEETHQKRWEMLQYSNDNLCEMNKKLNNFIHVTSNLLQSTYKKHTGFEPLMIALGFKYIKEEKQWENNSLFMHEPT